MSQNITNMIQIEIANRQNEARKMREQLIALESEIEGLRRAQAIIEKCSAMQSK